MEPRALVNERSKVENEPLNDKNLPLLAAAIMGRNEIETVERTIKSIVGIVDLVVFEDTGSTDGTQELVQRLCKENNLNLDLFESEFVDFSTSRNRLLDRTSSQARFLLLLDCNDELQNAKNLRNWCKRKYSKPGKDDVGLYYLTYHLNPNNTIYPAARLLRSDFQWRYLLRIQEYLSHPPKADGTKLYANQTVTANDGSNVILYQDRSKDSIKSIERMKTRDIKWFEQDIEDKTDLPRSYFYLAQTYKDIGEREKAIEYYKKRIEVEFEGNCQEVVVSYYTIGDLLFAVGGTEYDIGGVYLAAWRKSIEIRCERVEPLIRLALFYRNIELDFNKQGKHNIGRSYLHLACSYLSLASRIPIPNGALFMEKIQYDFYRWYWLSVAGYYVPEYRRDGMEACKKALDTIQKSPHLCNVGNPDYLRSLEQSCISNLALYEKK